MNDRLTNRSRGDLADEIVQTALMQYRRPDGYEGYLVEAAARLEEIGSDAWPVLCRLAQADVPELEHFVPVVLDLRGISWEQRLPTLLALAGNADANTRSRLLELAEDIPVEHRLTVLRALGASERPCDDVTDRAREIVAGESSCEE